jgi:N-acetylneuraminic acid mutarotase
LKFKIEKKHKLNMKKLTLVILGILFLNCAIFAQGPWYQKKNLGNTGRRNGIAFTINGKAFVGLGRDKDNNRLFDLWEYDQSTDNWTRKKDYPGAGSNASSAFAIAGKGYVCFGTNNAGVTQNDLWEYDPATDQWTQKNNCPGKARFGASCFVSW